MINMQPDFIWHKLSAHLASVMIALHDFFPQRLRHQLSLIFTVILFQCCFKADFFQLRMTIYKPRPTSAIIDSAVGIL